MQSAAAAGGSENADVIVVGAGLAGLGAARELRRRGWSVVLLEQRARPGGRICTERIDGAYLEHGGIFHTKGYPALRALLEEVGLAHKVVAPPSAFHAAVRRDGSWYHVDYGTPLTAPFRSRVLRWRDRLSIVRVALPALRAWRVSELGDLVELIELDGRSAIHGMTDAAADYFAAGPHEFLWGQHSRELSLAMLALQIRVFKGDLLELRGGMSQLIDRLAEDLDVRCATAVERVEAGSDGVAVRVSGDGGEPLRARATLLACPAHEAARIWSGAPDAVRSHLESMRYSRFDGVYLRLKECYEPRMNGNPLAMELLTTPEADGTLGGVYIPDSWADSGGLLLATAAPPAHAEDLGDEELADRLQADLERLHPGLTGQVTDRRVVRHYPYTPTFFPGSVRRLAQARQCLPAGRVDLAGDHLTAPWTEGALRSGQLAAERLDRVLRGGPV